MTDTPTISKGLQKIADADYHALRYCSKHALDVIHERSPMHLEHQRNNPKEPTEAMRFGSALHTFILEPEEFASRHVIIGQCEAMKKDKSRCLNVGRDRSSDGRWLCGVHSADDCKAVPTAITEEAHLRLHAMKAAIERCDAARELLAAPGENELAAIFDWMIQGDGWSHKLLCKLKVDAIRKTWDSAVDLKTCESAAPDKFMKSVGDLGYHRQAAFYLDGLEAAGVKLSHFILIAVEKEPPFGTAVYRLSQDAIELGREQNARLMNIYAACERSGFWHGYDATFNDISVPSYLVRKERAAI